MASMASALTKVMMARRRGAISSTQRERIGPKISKLRGEGVPQEQAVGMAHGMARAGRIGSRGGYRRVKKGGTARAH